MYCRSSGVLEFNFNPKILENKFSRDRPGPTGQKLLSFDPSAQGTSF